MIFYLRYLKMITLWVSQAEAKEQGSPGSPENVEIYFSGVAWVSTDQFQQIILFSFRD